jgi:hypothetical protein
VHTPWPVTTQGFPHAPGACVAVAAITASYFGTAFATLNLCGSLNDTARWIGCVVLTALPWGVCLGIVVFCLPVLLLKYWNDQQQVTPAFLRGEMVLRVSLWVLVGTQGIGCPLPQCPVISQAACSQGPVVNLKRQ